MTTRSTSPRAERPALTPLTDDGRLYLAPSVTAPGTSYQVQVSRDGTAAVCQCPGYAVRERCWHVNEAMRLYQQRSIRSMKEERKQMTQTDNPEPGTAVAVPQPPTAPAAQLGPLEPLPLQAARASLPSLYELRVYNELAKAAESGAGVVMPRSIKTAGQAIMVMLQGRELGIGPMTSLRHIYPIDGTMVPSAQLQMALVLRNDPSARFVFRERTATRCTVELHRGGHPVVVSSWSAEDSERARLSGKDNHKYYTTDMNTWMAVKRACRLGAPELLVFATSSDELALSAHVAEGLADAADDALLPEADPVQLGQAYEGDDDDDEDAGEGEDADWLEAQLDEPEPEPPAYDPLTMLPDTPEQLGEWYTVLRQLMRDEGVSEKLMAGTIGGELTPKRCADAARSMGMTAVGLVGLALSLK